MHTLCCGQLVPEACVVLGADCRQVDSGEGQGQQQGLGTVVGVLTAVGVLAVLHSCACKFSHVHVHAVESSDEYWTSEVQVHGWKA